MGSKETTTTSNGVSFLGLLFLVFLVLKLIGFITWSWWWVTAPLWGGMVLLALIGLVALLFYGVALLIKYRLEAVRLSRFKKRLEAAERVRPN
jgi:hypothetical protein